MTARPADDRRQPQIGVIDALRFLCEVFAVVSLAVWGFTMFPFWLNLVVGIGAPVLAILLWGLFRAPKAVFAVDPFVKALVEIVVLGTAAYAWADMHHWIVAGVFAAVAFVAGLITARREF
ncbi:MAG TPA: YrdB family protein [Gryllotalpicola sp.]